MVAKREELEPANNSYGGRNSLALQGLCARRALQALQGGKNAGLGSMANPAGLEPATARLEI